MTNQAFAESMVAALQTALSKNVSVGSVSVDGQTVTFNSRKELRDEYNSWRRELAMYSGRRPLSRGVNLGSAWCG